MSFVGISSVTKYTKLCSDHFDISAYENYDGHTTKRSLRKTAVPCRFVCTDKVKSGSYSVAKDPTQLNLQKQQCGSSAGVNSIVNLLPYINNDLSVITIGAFEENKQNFDEPISCIVSNSCVAVDSDTNTNLSNSSSVAVDLATSSNLSKNQCANIPKNNSCTQVLQEQVIPQTLFSNTQCNDNRTNLKRLILYS